jgi:hypothetical protein
MIEAIFAMSLFEFTATIIILIDFGPETIRKVRRSGTRAKEWWDK